MGQFLALILICALVFGVSSQYGQRYPVSYGVDPNYLRRDTPPSVYLANVARCAMENQTYCTRDDQYPTYAIERLLEKQIYKYADIFGEDEIATEIRNRVDAEEITLCESFEDVIYPTMGTNNANVDKLIVNTNKYKQGVRVSRCKNAGLKCHMSDGFPNGYQAKCKQHYVYRELLSVSANGETIKDKFKFEACCSCAVYRN